jgi:hypothetical protein
MTPVPVPPLVEVLLLGFPLPLFDRSREHMDGVMRELTFIAQARRSAGEHGVPERLLELVDELVMRYAGLNSAPEAARDAALERGDAEIDLAFRVPPDVGPDTRRFGDLLDEVDRYCAEGEHLLSLVTPPGPLRFRRWYLGEFLRQVDGGPPQRWEPRDWPWPVPLPDVPGAGSG